MENKKNTSFGKIMIVIFIVILVYGFFIRTIDPDASYNEVNTLTNKYSSDTFNIISSQENEQLENIIKSYANINNVQIEIEYAGTLEIIESLNNGAKYDAVWLANSMWGYMLENTKLTDSKSTSINPIIFGIKKSKAEELGFVGKTLYTEDIVNAISAGNLKFSMSNPTTTNSGASAYLGMLSVLAGNPEVLTADMLQDETLKTKLKTLFSGMERSSGDEDFLQTLFVNGDYEAVFTYESSIININQELAAKNKETLYALYPVDGVAIADSPLAFIDNKDEAKEEIFDKLQEYLLSSDGQAALQKEGRRTWYGGTSDNVDENVFNPEWGIDTTKYITPLKYPSTDVIKLALNMYQTELRKPVHIVFCLDYSGSMAYSGSNQMKAAMEYILTDEAAKSYIQFTEKDKIDVIGFASEVWTTWSTDDGSDTAQIVDYITGTEASGMTAMYPAIVKALKILQEEQDESYNLQIVVMTDGAPTEGTFADVKRQYQASNKDIPIYSIMFGSASEYKLKELADLSNAKVFDGRTDLINAFKEVRGYN